MCMRRRAATGAQPGVVTVAAAKSASGINERSNPAGVAEPAGSERPAEGADDGGDDRESHIGPGAEGEGRFCPEREGDDADEGVDEASGGSGDQGGHGDAAP